MSFQAKNELVRDAQLKVQTLRLPFAITANAVPASVVVGRDNPGVLFIKTEGVNQINAALDSNDTAPTLAAANDIGGVFNIMVKIGEELKKVLGAKVVRRNGQEVISCTLTSAPADSIVAGGGRDKIILNADSAVNLSTTNFDGYVEVSYIVE